MQINKDKPFYPVSMAAEMLGISPDRLRAYEDAGLIKPHRVEVTSKKQKGGRRLYSQNDIEWVSLLRQLIGNGISIPALVIIINLLPCFESYKLKEIQALKNNESWKVIKKLIKHPNYKNLIKD